MTVYAQYSKATNVISVLDGLDPLISIDAEEFREDYFDLFTCNTQGLDNWGRILNITRNISQGSQYLGRFGFGQVSNPPPNGYYPQNWNNGSFYNGQGTGGVTSLTDTQFRELLILRYRNITCNMSIGNINTIMNEYVISLDDTYKCLVEETSPMLLTYKYNFVLEDYQRTILSQRNILPVPSGVGFIIEEDATI